jgi:hypothetical protein
MLTPEQRREAARKANEARRRAGMPIGFAALTAEQRRELAGTGGKAAHGQKREHERTPEEARAAGRVAVLDLFGNPVSGSVVRLALVPIMIWAPGGFTRGSVIQATAVNGVATFRHVAIGTRGRYRLAAQIGSLVVLSGLFDVGLFGRQC